MSTLRKITEKHLKSMCEELGFKAYKGSYYRDEGDGFYSTLSFGFSSYNLKGHIFVSCSTGVSHKLMYEIYADNAGLKRPKYPDSIIDQGLGILKSNTSLYEYDITEESDILNKCKEIRMEIERYPLPYCKKHLSIDSISDVLLLSNSGWTSNKNIWMSIISYLKGNIQLALSYLDRIENKNGKYR